MPDSRHSKPSPEQAIDPGVATDRSSLPRPAGRGTDQSAGRPKDHGRGGDTLHDRSISNGEAAGNLVASSPRQERRPTAADRTASGQSPAPSVRPPMVPRPTLPPAAGAAGASPSLAGEPAVAVSFSAEEAFPRDLRWRANDVPHPDFKRISKAKAAIEQIREKSRKSQRCSRKARGAFAGDDEATATPKRIPDATAATLLVYIRRGHGLFERYRHEERLGALDVLKEDLDPSDFVIWLLGVRPFWSESTWRANRIAASTFISSLPHERCGEALALLESGIGRRPLYQYRSTAGEAADIPSATACRMDHDHLKKIRRALPLLRRHRKAARWLDDWLVAGLFTGLRPDEWSLAEVQRRPNEAASGRFWLHVVNANATEVGHRGSYRTLDLSGFSAAAGNAVARMASRGRQWTLKGCFAQRKSEVSRLLGTTSEALFGRMKLRYDLESLQHQFVANMKRVYRREQISALIGELFIDDQPTNYTNRRRAWANQEIVEMPIPIEDDVRRFHRILEIFEVRRVLREGLRKIH